MKTKKISALLLSSLIAMMPMISMAYAQSYTYEEAEDVYPEDIIYYDEGNTEYYYTDDYGIDSSIVICPAEDTYLQQTYELDSIITIENPPLNTNVATDSQNITQNYYSNTSVQNSQSNVSSSRNNSVNVSPQQPKQSSQIYANSYSTTSDSSSYTKTDNSASKLTVTSGLTNKNQAPSVEESKKNDSKGNAINVTIPARQQEAGDDDEDTSVVVNNNTETVGRNTLVLTPDNIILSNNDSQNAVSNQSITNDVQVEVPIGDTGRSPTIHSKDTVSTKSDDVRINNSNDGNNENNTDNDVDNENDKKSKDESKKDKEPENKEKSSASVILITGIIALIGIVAGIIFLVIKKRNAPI